MAGIVSILTSKPSGSRTQQEIMPRLNLENRKFISWEWRCKEKSPYWNVKDLRKLIAKNQREMHCQKFARNSGVISACLGGGFYWPGPQDPQGTGRGSGAREANYHAPRGNQRALHLRQHCRVERPPNKQVALYFIIYFHECHTKSTEKERETARMGESLYIVHCTILYCTAENLQVNKLLRSWRKSHGWSRFIYWDLLL